MSPFEKINEENEVPVVEADTSSIETIEPSVDSKEQEEPNYSVESPKSVEVHDEPVAVFSDSDADRLYAIRTELSGGVNMNEVRVEEPAPVSVSESDSSSIVSSKKSGGIVNTLRRWMGIAGVAAVGFGAMSESQGQSLPERETKKESVLGGVLRWAQRVDGEMAIEKKMYGNRWSPGPNEHTELRTMKGYAADVVDVVHADQNGNVVRVLQRAVHRKNVPVGVTVGISGGHGQGRILPGQRRHVPTNLYQANMMKQQGVNIGTMVRSSTGKVTMEVKPVKK